MKKRTARPLLIPALLTASILSVVWTGMAAAYKQSPMLDAAVKAHTLKSVQQRLPKTPPVVPVVKEIGKYGGTMRLAVYGPQDIWNIHVAMFSEPLIRWDRTGGNLIPNVAEKWTVSSDGLTYTFTLRKGILWSDGAPDRKSVV